MSESIPLKLTIPHHRAMFDSTKEWWRAEVIRRKKRLDAIYSIEDSEQRSLVLAADREACSRDVIYWLSNYAWIVDPHAKDAVLRDIPFVPWPKQQELIHFLLQRLELGQPALVNKGRKLGVTWLCMAICYHRMLFERSFLAKIGSRKEGLVDDGTIDSLFGKLRYLHDSQPPHLSRPVNTPFLKMTDPKTGGEIIGEGANQGFARGGRRTVVVVDEFAHLTQRLQSQTWLSTESVAQSMWIPSTPNGKANKFFELYTTLPSESIFEMDWKSDPGRSDDWKRQQIRPVGRLSEMEFAQEHECDFSAVLTGKIWVYKPHEITYNDKDEEFIEAREWILKHGKQVGGWDFGSGPSLLSRVHVMIDTRHRAPTIWVDNELTWKSSGWRQASADTRQMIGSYGAHCIDFGDPAGTHRESDQSSWEANLRSGGVPITCLPNHYQTRDGIEWMIKAVQGCFDDVRIRVHQRCHYILECMENWRRDAPDGVDLDWVSRAYIPPRKDVYSHGANALMYAVAGAFLVASRTDRAVSSEVLNLPSSSSGSISEVMDMSRNAGFVRGRTKP